MSYSPSPNCMGIAAKAADQRLTQTEILDAFAEIDAEAQRIRGDGLGNDGDRIHKFARDLAEEAKVAAAMQKRMAAINVLAAKRFDAHIDTLLNSGMAEDQALLSFMEGAHGRYSGALNGRKSVWALQAGGRKRYVTAGIIAQIQRERPQIMPMLFLESFDDAVTREMHELRDGGKPGITGNEDAKWAAKAFADWQELSRIERNRAGGAGIGKLAGRAAAQVHDDIKMVKAGKERWIGFIVGNKLLDVARTFGEGTSSNDLARMLGDIYDTIITGLPNKPTPAELGQRVGPRNLAKSLGKHRVLHFKDADAAIMYRKEFGHGGTIKGIISELGRAGDQLGLFQALGSNPEVLFTQGAERLKRRIKESNLPDKVKAQRTAAIDLAADSRLRGALDIATGAAMRPAGDGRWAAIGENIRSVQRMASLGGVVLTSLPGDAATTAIASQARGSGFWRGFAGHVSAMMRGRARGEQAEIGYLGGEGADGLISALLGGRVALDSPSGAIATAQDWFFRLNGLTSTTDIARQFNARMIQAELGMHSGKTYGELYDEYRHVLGLHGIDEKRWDVLRQAQKRVAENGKPYITPDLVRALPDAAFEPLIRDRLAEIKGKANYDQSAAAFAADARRELEMDLHAFFADEVSYGVVTPDAAAQRITTWGAKRRGTKSGELARYVMQFLSTPIAFVQRPLSRTIFGQAHGPKDIRSWGHAGTAIAALMAAGYLSMTMKDVMRGYWPPRDPGDYRTWMAAGLQSGALGIYGDFLFSQVNRSGKGLSETLNGPFIGNVVNLLQIYQDARDFALSGGEDKFSGAQAFSTIWGMVPYANLFYVKSALDYLFVNSFREMLSPGYLRKQSTTRKRQYGQESFMPIPPTLAQTVGG